MSKFLVGADLTREIAAITAGGAADLAVAFWGAGACDTLKLPKKTPSLRVACDARSGACNPEALRDLLDRGAQIVDVPRLHAKVYIGPNSVVIASANASANGLGEEGKELDTELDAGYLTTEETSLNQSRSWFKNLLITGRKITHKDINEIENLWKRRRSSRPEPDVRVQKGRKGRRTFLEMTLTNPDWAEGRNLWAMLYNETVEHPPEAVDMYKQSPFYSEGGEHDFYSWEGRVDDVQIGDYILDIEVYEGNKTYCNGVWIVQDILSNGKVIPVKYVPDPFGLKFSKKDIVKVAELSKLVFKEYDDFFEEDSIEFISFTKFAEIISRET